MAETAKDKEKAPVIRDRRARREAEEDQVTVSLRKAKTFRGRAYGPGPEVSMPKRIAERMGLTGDGKGKATARARRAKNR